MIKIMRYSSEPSVAIMDGKLVVSSSICGTGETPEISAPTEAETLASSYLSSPTTMAAAAAALFPSWEEVVQAFGGSERSYTCFFLAIYICPSKRVKTPLRSKSAGPSRSGRVVKSTWKIRFYGLTKMANLIPSIGVQMRYGPVESRPVGSFVTVNLVIFITIETKV